MLRLFQGRAVDMVDPLAHRVILPSVRRPGKAVVVAAEIEGGAGRQVARRNGGGQVWGLARPG